MSLVNMSALAESFRAAEPLRFEGTVVRARGIVVEAALPGVSVGTTCEIRPSRGRPVNAEVVGVSGTMALLMPYGSVQGLGAGCRVVPIHSGADVPVGPALLGRVVDALLRPIDGGALPLLPYRVPLHAPPPPALQRRRIASQLATGIKAVDTLLCLGEGQRVAVMAGPGVGKSVTLGMIARASDAEVVVVGLIGERGREVREFVERDLGPAGLRRSVIVVATGDESPLMRVRAALAATAIAEHFRAQGKRALLLMDSLSRVAMAQREIGLAAGEPPTTKGYPPSVFALLPQLVERAGNDSGKGSITALYTVLAEGDDLSDPVADAARAALDGHWVLSRRLAESGHFPAIDVLASVSRVMTDIVTRDHRDLAGSARDVLSAYRDSADLIEVGAYVAGSNARVDRALRCLPGLRTFLRQAPEERGTVAEAMQGLRASLTVKESPRA